MESTSKRRGTTKIGVTGVPILVHPKDQRSTILLRIRVNTPFTRSSNHQQTSSKH